MKIPPASEKDVLLERRILGLNTRIRKSGSWNLIVALAGISLAAKSNRPPSIAWLSRHTDLSGSTLSGLLAELDRQGYVETFEIHGKSWRRPTQQGSRLLNDLGEHSFGFRRKSTET